MGPATGTAHLAGLRAAILVLAALSLPDPSAAACTDYASSLHWVGFADDAAVSDDTQEMVIAGDYLYAASAGDGFRVWDISDPGAPVLAASLDLGGLAQAIALRDNYAFVAASGPDSLFVVNISNPLEPVRAAAIHMPFGAWFVALTGDYAIVTAGSDTGGSVYHVVDISPPTAPVIVASPNTFGLATYYVAILGNYAYFEIGSSGIAVVDITDPRNPVDVTTVNTPGGPDDLFIAGSHLYIADFCGGLQIMDLANPAAPALVGGAVEEDCMDGVRVVGNTAFLAETTGGLAVYDVSDPSAPAYVTNLPASGCPDCIAVSETHAYVGSCTGGIDVYELASHASPDMLALVASDDRGTDVALAGDYAYLADYSGGLILYDVSPPTAPLRRGSTVAGLCQANGIAIQGGLAYLTDRCGLRIFDVSDPFAPDSVGSLDLGITTAVAVDASYAYVTIANSGLQLVDITDPANPAAAGFVAVTGNPNDVALSGPYAFVAAMSGGVAVVDVTSPMSPTVVGVADTDFAQGVAAAGELVLVADEVAGLAFISLANPEAPQVLAATGFPVDARAVAISGSHAYVTALDHGTWVFDVSDPFTRLAPLGSIPALAGGAADEAIGIAALGEVVAVASFERGLKLLPAQCADTQGPELAIGVLQNPVVTSSVDIYVSSSEALPAAPEVSAGGSPLVLEETVGGEAPLYRGRYTLSGAGAVAISASASDGSGNESLAEYAFVSFPVGRAGGYAAGASGALELTVPPGALSREIYLTIAAPSPGTFEIQPFGTRVPGMAARLRLPDAADPSRFGVEVERSGAWEAVPCWHAESGGALYVTLETTGRLRLREGETAGSRPLPGAVSLRFAASHPSAGSAELLYGLPAPGAVTLEIFDVSGRRVRTLLRGVSAPGVHRAVWDGRDDAGAAAAPGVYLARLSHPAGSATQKLVTVR